MRSSGGPTDVAVGMMDGAYFTSRSELLEFFNDLLKMSLTKIEHTATGAVACQLMDYMYPGTIPMKRVNWEAKSEFQYIENYKLLQSAFDKNSIQKYVDVDRLIRAKYQDNLEFCQWLKAFCDQAATIREDYDAIGRRSIGKGGKNLEAHFMPGKQRSGGGAGAFVARPASATAAKRVTVPSSLGNKGSPPGRKIGAASGGRRATDTTGMRGPFSPSTDEDRTEAIVADAQLMKKNSSLMTRNAELELTLSIIEKERDFYFETLRSIEVLLQVHQEKGEDNNANSKDLIDNIFKVLYATADDNIVVTDEGEIVEDTAAGRATNVHQTLMDETFTDELDLLDD